MAFQTRERDPLIDGDVADVLSRRGREIFGLTLVGLGILIAVALGSYAPEDPSWISSNDAPVQNWLGPIGAAVAAPLFMIVGFASWSVALVPIVWGLRFILNHGRLHAFSRLIYVPIWVALVSLTVAVLTPSEAWANMHSFGLGGLFGDMALGAALSILPLGSVMLLWIWGAVSLMVGIFVLGFTIAEVRQGIASLRLLAHTLILWSLYLLRDGMNGAARVSATVRGHAAAMRDARLHNRQTRRTERQAMRAMPEHGYDDDYEPAAQAHAMRAGPVVRRTSSFHDMEPPLQASKSAGPAPLRAEPRMQYDDMPEPDPVPAPEPVSTGLLSRVPGFLRRNSVAEAMPEPEYVDRETDAMPDVPPDERVKARIADAIRSRARRSAALRPELAAEEVKRRHRGGPKPLILDTERATVAAAGLPPEPPLQATPRAQATSEPLHMPFMRGKANHAQETPMIEVEPLIEPEDQAWDQDYETDYAEDYAQEYAPEPMSVPQAAPRQVVQQPVRKPLAPSQRARAEAQPSLQFTPQESHFELPPLALLADPGNIERQQLSDEALEQNARMLENVLDDYGVKGEIVSVRPGPVVTMYELEPAPGLKASRVIGLADDIARSMSALSARVSTVPGRSVIGIELPNDYREMVLLRELLASRDFGDGKQSLPLALGKDIGGDPVISNLAKMPHLLIAGTTGSGKSVAINTMILSLLYNLTPEQCRLIMIDPKMLELSVYDGIPHLLSPVVTDPKKAVVALKWVVAEMEERYRKMSKMGVRNIDGYNGRVKDALSRGELFSRTMQTGFDDQTGDPIFETEEFAPEKMPYIVVIVDEMADLMMVAGKEIEACIQRLAQMARASGIHLIMATQRPSVDVITGTIKANFPTRISFQVTSKIDSRTILGEMGAEQLLGMGDMLYMAGGGKITRCHAPFVSDEEVEEVVNHLKSFGPPEYIGGVVEGPDEEKASDIDAVLGLGGNTNGEDALYDQAVAVVIKDRKCSTSYVQRKLAIGYNKAARLVEQMEEDGLVSPANHVGKRDILVPEQ